MTAKAQGGGLFVITPTPITFKEFVDVAAKMGNVTLQDKERFFVEVVLNRDKFEARPASAALQDERHQYFVLANLKELSCLDIRARDCRGKAPGFREAGQDAP